MDGADRMYEVPGMSYLGRFGAMVVWPGYSRHLPSERHFVPAVCRVARVLFVAGRFIVMIVCQDFWLYIRGMDEANHV